MRKLILSMNTSLNGIVTDELSWMKPDTDQTWHSLFEMLSTVDLLLLGGGMWEDYKNYWKKALTETGYTNHEINYARYAEKTKHIVFSSTLKDAGWENAEIEPGDVTHFIPRLKSESGGDMQIVGGARFATGMINTGLIDEYRIMVNPLILGSGISLYRDVLASHTLECFRVEPMDNGVVILSYRQLH